MICSERLRKLRSILRSSICCALYYSNTILLLCKPCVMWCVEYFMNKGNVLTSMPLGPFGFKWDIIISQKIASRSPAWKTTVCLLVNYMMPCPKLMWYGIEWLTKRWHSSKYEALKIFLSVSVWWREKLLYQCINYSSGIIFISSTPSHIMHTSCCYLF